MPDPGVLATILLIVGLFLLALELMIPSFGMIGIMSAVTLLISAWCAWQAWWGTSPGFFWTYAGFWLLGIPSVLGGMLFLMQNTSLGDRVVLRASVGSNLVPLAQEQRRLEHLVGQIGTASSLLMPGGIVIVDGERFHAESNGLAIESGAYVEVVQIKTNRLVVKETKSSPPPILKRSRAGSLPNVEQNSALSDTQPASPHDNDSSDILDFDIPEDYTRTQSQDV